jgi:malonate transporter
MTALLDIYTLLSQRHGHGSVSAAAVRVTTVLSFFSLSALLWVLQLQPV